MVEKVCEVMIGTHCLCWAEDDEFSECCYCDLGASNCIEDEEEERGCFHDGDPCFHKSDCAVHREPAEPAGECNCQPVDASALIPVS